MTWYIEFQDLFGLDYRLKLESNKNNSQYGAIIQEKIVEFDNTYNKWTSMYADTWNSVANKLVNYYLLNVKQVFWINHSIRQLMRTIMYSSDEIWSKNNLFDVGVDQQKKNLDNLPKEKQETGKMLTKSIKLLNFKEDGYSRLGAPNLDEVLTKQDDFAAKIFNTEETLEEYYLKAYEIQKSPWISLLGSVQHIGSNKNPLKNENQENTSTTTSLTIGKDFKINEIIKDLKPQNNQPKFVLSKSLTLLLALSTRIDKVEGVEKTLQFANIITQISNQPCEQMTDEAEVSVGESNVAPETNAQVGGNRKKYKIIKQKV